MSQEAPIAPSTRHLATLKCYGPTGANVAEIIVHADGSTTVREGSDLSLLKPVLATLREIDLRRFRGVRS